MPAEEGECEGDDGGACCWWRGSGGAGGGEVCWGDAGEDLLDGRVRVGYVLEEGKIGGYRGEGVVAVEEFGGAFCAAGDGDVVDVVWFEVSVL